MLDNSKVQPVVNFKTTQNGSSVECVEFDSLHKFHDYLMSQPFNRAFGRAKSSVRNEYDFFQTKTFGEAMELFTGGWSVMAGKLSQRIKADESKQVVATTRKSVVDVHGYQPIVPLYLNNVPANMVNKKTVAQKQKVITLNKSMDYPAYTTTARIVEESVKALRIVKKLESMGYRINLNVVLGEKQDNTLVKGKYHVFFKVLVKSAGERLNISKLAFCMVHPSMFRRLFFRLIEVYPTIHHSMTAGYGYPFKAAEAKQVMDKNEYLLPAFITNEVEAIKSVDDLVGL